MYLLDYHMHSRYSFDGCESIDAMCEEAIKKGLKEIAITDHMDFFRDKKYSRHLDYEQVYKSILHARETYDGKLIIRAGVEIGQPQAAPQDYQHFLDQYPLDFIIGSIHNLEDPLDVGEYCFLAIDYKALYNRYLESLIELAETYDFDVIGHLTYPMRYMYEQIGIYPDMKPFKERIEVLYKTLIKRDKGIEVNISGLFQKLGRPMPDLELLKFYKACGGKIITLGCDAHRLEHIGYSVVEGLELIKEAGFNEVTTFEKRQPLFKGI